MVETMSGGTAIVSGTVANSGTLFASGSHSLVQIASGAVVSGGSAKVGNGIVDIQGPSSENVSFLSTGTGGLELDDAVGGGYTGAVSGFGGVNHSNHTQFIEFTQIASSGATLSYTAANAANTSGTLTVSNGGTSASIELIGHYSSSNFKIGHDSAGHVVITDPALSSNLSEIGSGSLTTLAGSTNTGLWTLFDSSDNKLALLANYIAGSFGIGTDWHSQTPLAGTQQGATAPWLFTKPHV
jgi:hypothetical protein